MTGSGFIILAVEDDADDVFFLKQAFKHAGMAGALRVARDGEEAIAYLLGLPPFTDRLLYPRPNLVLLDLNLPRRTGLEVLAWRQKQPEQRRIPFIVLTSSASDADIANAYDLGANSYLVKPIGTEAQTDMVRSIRHYWHTLNHASSPGSVPSHNGKPRPDPTL